MNGLKRFLSTSYSAFQTAENAARYLNEHGFLPLDECEPWNLQEGGKYYVVRGGNSLIAFRYGAGSAKIAAAHTDSPCLKLKENAALADKTYTRLNTEPYGGGLWYSFFDRPLKIAGRVVRESVGKLLAENYVSDFVCVLPSLAIHQQRDANEKFAPNLQTELPLYGLGEVDFAQKLQNAVSYDLFAAPAVEPFESGADGEFLSSPRLDDLTGVYAALRALAEGDCKGLCVAACLCSEEIGSRTYGGAGSGFLRAVLRRVAAAQGKSGEEFAAMLASSFLLSIDNAHSLHPNHPEKCDPTNRAALGGGVAVKTHAGGAYTTDAFTFAIVKTAFERAGVKVQSFCNRSDMASGSTLGAISLTQASIPSADIGIAQLAMHSAVETIAKSDYFELEKAVLAYFGCEIGLKAGTATIK